MNHESTSPARIESPRRPYVTPVLEVFGGVAGLTATANMSGAQKDGGPNNIKS